MIRDTVLPAEVERDTIYIGLQHIHEGKLILNGHGQAGDVTSLKSRFQTGDILFGKLRPYFRKVIRAPFNGICSTDIWVVRPSSENIGLEFLYYVMASQEFIDFATLGSEGTRMPRAKWEHISRFEINLPALTEQQAIAHILCSLDDKIELNRRMNETLEEMAWALFKSWFVDYDPVQAKMDGRWQPGQSLPGLPAELYELFPDRLVPSELGEIPKGWQVKSLDKIATFTNGLALQKFPATGEKYLPVIKIAEMRRGYTPSSGKASLEIDHKYIVEDGDLLFSWSGSLEVVLWTHGRGALNQHLFKVSSVLFPKWFYWGWVKRHLAEFRQIAASKATTMGHIQRHHLKEALVVVPPEDILTIGDQIIMPFLTQYITKALESRSLAELRDTLLPKLLSGEIRIDDLENIPE